MFAFMWAALQAMSLAQGGAQAGEPRRRRRGSLLSYLSPSDDLIREDEDPDRSLQTRKSGMRLIPCLNDVKTESMSEPAVAQAYDDMTLPEEIPAQIKVGPVRPRVYRVWVWSDVCARHLVLRMDTHAHIHTGGDRRLFCLSHVYAGASKARSAAKRVWFCSVETTRLRPPD